MKKAALRFEVTDTHCSCRLTGRGSLEKAAAQVVQAITEARGHGLRKLLIDVTGWTGHDSPSTVQRYDVASIFSQAAGPTLKLALLVRPELMDPGKFEVTVATNRGMNGNVFDSEKDAVGWLLAGNAP